ncbi:hypothetical protein Ctob_011280, partial [Chrysochromulina tobinii]
PALARPSSFDARSLVATLFVSASACSFYLYRRWKLATLSQRAAVCRYIFGPRRVPLVRLWGPRIRGARKHLGGSPDAACSQLFGVPAHSRAVLRLDLITGSVSTILSPGDGRSILSQIPKGPFKWLRGVLGPDGCVYCIPACADFVLRVYPDCSLSTLGRGELPTGEWKWHGGCLGSDGNIYAPPANAPRVLKIEPASHRASMVGPELHPDLKNKWYGAIKAADGAIWCMPYNAPTALKIVPESGEVHELGSFPRGGWKWHGGARCGRFIVGIPSHADSVLLIETATETLTLVSTGIMSVPRVPGYRGYQWGGGVADGHHEGAAVWAVPSDASHILKIVASAGTVTPIGGLPVMKNKWQGAVHARDGHVYCIPCDAPNVLRIDPRDGSFSLHGSLGDCTNKFQGAYQHTDGTIWALPESCEQVLRIDPPDPFAL